MYLEIVARASRQGVTLDHIESLEMARSGSKGEDAILSGPAASNHRDLKAYSWLLLSFRVIWSRLQTDYQHRNCSSSGLRTGRNYTNEKGCAGRATHVVLIFQTIWLVSMKLRFRMSISRDRRKHMSTKPLFQAREG
ncbi:hypothetical protein K443DRAFT_121689 [Laccaria amethystina LaAM-08-1]|uniref:Uncharacterized protein n=1 Tax=Laccaria amethystina LaAM-08-1 TaxID=1095629 RepID=A0A0C9WUT2_9AGAR|nr:hypothetical protein K443DRAFT_121689 [Laccaria amethystina LaAM-08-1]